MANGTIFCVCIAADEALIREHSRLSGFPANVVTELRAVIDPATAGWGALPGPDRDDP